MSHVYPSIQGCPFRKVVSRVHKARTITEVLSCGHTVSMLEDARDQFATKRRCYVCKREAEEKS